MVLIVSAVMGRIVHGAARKVANRMNVPAIEVAWSAIAAPAVKPAADFAVEGLNLFDADKLPHMIHGWQ